jgi:hypothetical protein
LGLSSFWSWADFSQDTDGVFIFLTGQEAGALKPCGCSGGQLGGLERRAALWEKVAPDQRLVLSTGNLVSDESEQNLIKYPIFLQAYQILGYDLANLTSKDLEIGSLAGAVDIVEALGIQPMATQGDDFGIRPNFSRVFTVGQQDIQVNVIAVDSTQYEHLDVLDTAGVTIFIINDANQTLRETVLGQADAHDCVVFPESMDEPRLLKKAGQGPMEVSIGQRGRYVCQLRITLQADTGEPSLAFSFMPVSEDLVRNEEIKDLYKSYQQIVATSELQESYVRVPLTDRDLTYEGSHSCEACHAEEYQIWSANKHAHAFATLVDVGSQRDPECTVCHVVGMDYDVGYLTQADTPKLKDVGCEVCHGPGSEHNRSFGKIRTQNPQMKCLDCHTPEHSGGYAGHEQEFLKKIKHWKEPKPVRTVKE